LLDGAAGSFDFGQIAGNPAVLPLSGAVFAVNMLLATEGGNTYTFEEVEKGLMQAGFIRVRLLQRGEHMDGLVEGFKP
jgi:hypothetical protein